MRMYLLLAILSTTVFSALVPSAAAAQGYYPPGPQVGARVWVENDRDYFRRGDRLDVRFSVSDDAYVAVVHVDTNGNLDFLYPTSPWENEYVRGGRVYTLPSRGAARDWRVRGSSGIGYLYLLASPRPLDFSYFRGRNDSPWDWGYAGRTVRGDPFLAFDQISRLLLPVAPFGGYAEDYYGYHVGGFHRYPSYVCSDRYGNGGWGWTPAYSSCGQMDYFLRDYPYYYDTRRYQGDRRTYLRQYDRLDPRYGYKEDPDAPVRRAVPRSTRQDDARPDGGRGNVQRSPSPARGVDRREPAPARSPEPSAEQPRGRAAPAREPNGRVAPERTRPEAARPQPAAGRGSSDRDIPESTGRRPAIGQPPE